MRAIRVPFTIGYWIGREYCGRGIATAALAEFLGHDLARPLHAFVAVHNIASIRVVEECGFVRMDDATTAPSGVDEYLYRFGSASARFSGSVRSAASGSLGRALGYKDQLARGAKLVRRLGIEPRTC